MKKTLTGFYFSCPKTKEEWLQAPNSSNFREFFFVTTRQRVTDKVKAIVRQEVQAISKIDLDALEYWLNDIRPATLEQKMLENGRLYTSIGGRGWTSSGCNDVIIINEL